MKAMMTLAQASASKGASSEAIRICRQRLL
jgi:hypothetical protein